MCHRNAVIGALMSRQDLPLPMDEMLLTRASSSCGSDLLTPCDTSGHVTATTTATVTASETIDVSDVSVTLSVPVAAVSSLSSAVDSNQTDSSLVSFNKSS